MANTVALIRFWRNRKYGALSAILALSLMAPSAYALPDDREQPINISADRALRDESKGVTVYSGSVLMRQGSMELEAERITFYHSTETADQIVAQGSPAKMRQQPEPAKGLVHAEADTIHYFRQEQRIRLQTNARIEQDGALVTGDSIDYFIELQLVKAQANENEAGDKVFVVIPPDVQSGAQVNAQADTEEVTQGDKPSPEGITPVEEASANGATEGQ